jgi:hypothetical protein
MAPRFLLGRTDVTGSPSEPALSPINKGEERPSGGLISKVFRQNIFGRNRQKGLPAVVGNQDSAQWVFGIPFDIVSQYLASRNHRSFLGLFEPGQIDAFIVFGEKIATLEMNEESRH